VACCNEPLSVSFAATAAVRANAAPITTAIENATTTLNTMQLPQLNPSAPNASLARRHDDHVTLTSARPGAAAPIIVLPPRRARPSRVSILTINHTTVFCGKVVRLCWASHSRALRALSLPYAYTGQEGAMPTAEMSSNSCGEQSAPKPLSSAALTLLRRVWPLTCVGIALIANAIWIGFLGYWLAKLF